MSALILQCGLITVIIAASPSRAFDLDRFLVPKELVLHVTAVLAATFALAALRRVRLVTADVLLVGFLIVSIVSGAMAANRWLAMRAVAVTASGLLIFWTARALSSAGLQRRLRNTLALAVVLAAFTSLAQAYGLRLDVFSPNRSPGGTLGNRNFVAHAAAFGLPVCILAAALARRAAGYASAALGIALVTAALVLTRSRAAWIAAFMALGVLAVAFVISRASRQDRRLRRRLAGAVLFVVAGSLAALLIPNSLRWNSANPYLKSVNEIANYEEGSGRGRLIQYERSLRMAAAYPLFGVGPGNWPVVYPDYAAPRDPSLNPSEPGATFNPWPSSDWMAFVSERGFAGVLLMGIALIIIAAAAVRRLRQSTDPEESIIAAVLIATMVAAAVAGVFDAVLVLALPALIVWMAVGALSPRVEASAGLNLRVFAVMIVALSVAGAFRSGAQLVGMEIYAMTDSRPSLVRATQIDPANYRAHMKLARSGRNRCRHALAARALLPNARAARDAARGCDQAAGGGGK